jgi:Icc-related predicted phosphoesterase
VRFRRRGGRRTRILFATDLHGSEVVFRKFLNAVAVYEADVAILGGDLTGKRIVPVIDDGGRFTADVGGVDQVASDEPTLAALEEQIRDLGQYPLVVARPEYERLASHPDAVEERFVSACHAQVEDWMRRAMERLEPLGVPLFVTGGNDDYLSIETILDAAPFITNAEGRLVEVAPGVEMVSTGYGNRRDGSTSRAPGAVHLQPPRAAVRIRPGRLPETRYVGRSTAPRRRGEHLCRVARSARRDPTVPAAAVAPRTHPRVGRDAAHRTYDVPQSGERERRGHRAAAPGRVAPWRSTR